MIKNMHGAASAKGDEEWVGCPIFQGKLVNANGWCNAWAPKNQRRYSPAALGIRAAAAR